MSEKNPPAGAAAAPGADAAKTGDSKVAALTEQLKQLETETRTIEGRLKNRDPRLTQQLTRENAELQKRLVLLQKTLYAVISDAVKPRTASDFQQKHKVLQQAAIDFFKQAQIDQELWKNIES